MITWMGDHQKIPGTESGLENNKTFCKKTVITMYFIAVKKTTYLVQLGSRNEVLASIDKEYLHLNVKLAFLPITNIIFQYNSGCPKFRSSSSIFNYYSLLHVRKAKVQNKQKSVKSAQNEKAIFIYTQRQYKT